MGAHIRFRRVGLLLAALVLFAGCGSSNKGGDGPTSTTAKPATRPAVVFAAHEYGYTGPSVLPTGYVDISVHNIGHQDHQAQIVRVASTTTIAEIQTLANATNPMSLTGALYVGGPNNTAPGQTATTTVYLTAGRYAMFCYLPGPGGKA